MKPSQILRESGPFVRQIRGMAMDIKGGRCATGLIRLGPYYKGNFFDQNSIAAFQKMQPRPFPCPHDK